MSLKWFWEITNSNIDQLSAVYIHTYILAHMDTDAPIVR